MATVNRIRALNRLPFDFEDGLKIGGVDVTNLKQFNTAAGAGLVGFTPVGGLSATNVQAAIAELDGEKARLDALAANNGTPGAALVGYDGGTLKDVADNAKPITDYTALRAYTGTATKVRITATGIDGFFYRDDADTASTDNGGTIIVSSDGKRWKRYHDANVNVLWFMTPAQVSDVMAGTKLIDVSNAFNAALAAAPNSATINVPPYDYRVSQPIVMPANKYWQKIKGSAGPEAGGGNGVRSRLDFWHLPANSIAITTGGKSYIEDIGIFGPGATAGGSTTGVYVRYEAVLKNTAIQSFNVGFDVKQCWYTRLENASFRFNSLGIKADTFHNLTLTGCSIGGGGFDTRTPGQESGNGILILTGGELHLRGGSIEAYWGAGGYGIRLSGTGIHLSVDGVYFEPYGDATHQAGPAILLDGSSGASVNVKNCYCYIYYQDAFIKVSDETFNYTLTSIGNRFVDSSIYKGLIYQFPSSDSYKKSATVLIAGDNLKGVSGTLPTYISPDITARPENRTNITVYPPRLGHDSAVVMDHEFIGRPAVNPALGAPPANPTNGVIYWANGTTWNPFRSYFNPYPVIYDGTKYHQVAISAALRSYNNASGTLMVNENALAVPTTTNITLALPASPPEGSRHTIKQFGGTFTTTINGNGLTFDASGNTNYVFTVGSYECVTFLYNSLTNKWLLISKF